MKPEFSAETIELLDELAHVSSYPAEAYEFVLSEVIRLMRQRELLPVDKRSISDELLCWKLHDRALLEFKDQARIGLAKWNIHSTEDFGTIVYGLLESGLVTKDDTDSERNFENVYDFQNAFNTPHFKRAQLFPTRWRVSTLLLITTVSAIALAGFSSLGFAGASGTLFCSWLMLMGGYLAYLGATERTNDWLLAVVVGAIVAVVGVLGFVIHTH